MSYPPNPPHLPPAAPAAPIPVQPLAYVPPNSGRPGILTAIAVISIVVGSLGILVSGLSTLYGVGFAFASSAMSRMPASPPTATTPAATQQSAATDDGTAPTDDGMTAPERQTTLAALTAMRDLSDARQKHLSALLAQAGHKVLPMTGDALTRNAVVANCTDTGQLPSPSPKSPGADFFVFARGRLEVNDHHAVFYPTGAGEPIRASATEDDSGTATDADTSAKPTPSGVGSPAGGPLTDAQVNQVISTIESRARTKLTPAQSQSLRAQLKLPTQTLFTPATGPALTRQLTSAGAAKAIGSGGATVTFATNTGLMSVGPQGQVSSTSFMAGPGSMFPNILTQAVLVAVFSALSAALAVYLLVIGILMVRNSPAGRRLHLLYAYLKIPLAIAAGISWWWMWSSFIKGMPGFAGASSGFGAMATVFSIPMALGLLYPIALLIALHTRTVKDYYNFSRPA